MQIEPMPLLVLVTGMLTAPVQHTTCLQREFDMTIDKNDGFSNKLKTALQFAMH